MLRVDVFPPVIAERGFTLLEVLVALAVIGIGFSTAFGVVSGVHKLESRVTAQNFAILFARVTLDEFLETGAISDSDTPGDVVFGGQTFSYRLIVRPFEADPIDITNGNRPKSKLDQVEINVFWGSPNSKQTYSLVTLVDGQTSGNSPKKSQGAPAAFSPKKPE